MFSPRSRTISALSGAFMTAILGTACSHARETDPAPMPKDDIAFILDATRQAFQPAPPMPASGQPSFFLALGETASSPKGYIEWCLREQDACLGDVFPQSPSIITLTQERWRELNEVNTYWNAVLRPQTDLKTYGVEEYWTVPAPGGFADCEDYVLAKRKDLMARGWPREALLITIVRDSQNLGHAVLTVRTDLGDLTLDSLNNAIVPWTKSPHKYVKVQNPNQPSDFVAAKPQDSQAPMPVALRAAIK